MGRLVLVRKDPRDIMHRYAIMRLDGKLVRRMGWDERYETEVAPGRHVLSGKNELGSGKSVEFEIEEGQTVTVAVVAAPGGCFGVVLWLLPAAPRIELSVIEG